MNSYIFSILFSILSMGSIFAANDSSLLEDEYYMDNEDKEYQQRKLNSGPSGPCDDVYLLTQTISQTIDINGVHANRTKDDYSYNGDQLVQRLNYRWKASINDWVNKQKYTYSYDANDDMTLRIRQDWKNNQWVNRFRYENTYDNNHLRMIGLRSDWNTTTNQWTQSRKYIYTYNNNGELIERILQKKVGLNWVNDLKYDYTIASNGLRSSNVISKWNGTSWDTTTKYDYSYNSMACLILRERSTKVGISWEFDAKWDYTYDSNNNEKLWVKSNFLFGFAVPDSQESTSWTLYYQNPNVSITPINGLCESVTTYSLTASPPGGIWGGVASSNGQINPSSLGVGTHNVTYEYTTPYGCMLSASLNFNIGSSTQSNHTEMTCFQINVGIDTMIIQNQAGCDSLIITETVYDPNLVDNTFLNATTCDAMNVGVDTVVMTNQAGCDSLVITTTTLTAPVITQLGATTCFQNQVGVDTLTLQAASGCDSLVITTTTLDINLGDQTFLNATTCDAMNVGVDTVIMTNQSGCDSLVVTITALTAPVITELGATTCFQNQVGVDTLTLQAASGCDSLVITTTTLDMDLINETHIEINVCENIEAGIDTLTLTNLEGCDSLVITTKIYVAPMISNHTESTCDKDKVGIDTMIVQNLAGCDSLWIITETTLLEADTTIITEYTCDPENSGSDTLFLQNQAGCDSLVITNTLLTDPPKDTIVYATTCDPTEAGVDTTHYVSAMGCDSVVMTEITYVPIQITAFSEYTCDMNEAGKDTMILQTQQGCDSLIVTTYELISHVIAQDDTYSIDDNKLLVENVLENDDFDKDNIMVNFSTSINDFEIDQNGELQFQPNKNSKNLIEVEYEICDTRCEDNCDMAKIMIEVIHNTVYVPSGISPNGDGKNDVWIIPELENNDDNRLIIINRWGQTILDASPYKNDWDGKSLSGKPLPEGTYYYNLKLGKDLSKSTSGTITILR